MVEGLLEPAHLIMSLFLFLLWFGIPIWFCVYVVRSLKQINLGLREISARLPPAGAGSLNNTAEADVLER